jgi:hypothetical protein
MTILQVFLPLFVEVVLTFALLFWMASLRTAAITRGEVALGDIALRQPGWPPRVTQVANAFHNQLEIPLLFYVLVIIAWETRHAGTLFVAMSWAFVILRLVHAAIHVMDNNVRRRGLAFILGVIVLAAMWAIYITEIVVGV